MFFNSKNSGRYNHQTDIILYLLINSNLNKVKAGDSEEFDNGAMIVGNIDNSNPAVNKICIGYSISCYSYTIKFFSFFEIE